MDNWRAGLRRACFTVSPWTGAAALILVLGGSLALQGLRAWSTTSSPPHWLFLGPAVASGVAGLVALGSGRLRWPLMVLAALVGVWLGAGFASALAVSGQANPEALLAAAVCAGLVLAVAGMGQSSSGWILGGVGIVYIVVTWLVLWHNYYSSGSKFPGTAMWVQTDPDWDFTPTPVVRPEKAVEPAELLARIRTVLGVGNLESTREYLGGFYWNGLAGNPNASGTIVAVWLVFLVPFLAHRWRPWWDSHRTLVVAGRILLLAVIVPFGLSMLWVLEARTALGGALAAIIILTVPLRWARRQLWSWAFALTVLVVTMLPFVMTRLLGTDAFGRACTWQSWINAMRPSPLWGVGSPGIFPNTGCDPALAPEWYHAHNEILQAWSKGGLLGLVAAVTILSGLAWWAMRHRDLDDRILMALMVFSAMLMGTEVLNTAPDRGVNLGLVLWVSIAARSAQLMSERSEYPRLPPRGEPQLSARA